MKNKPSHHGILLRVAWLPAVSFAIALLAGCVSRQTIVLKDAVGPEPQRETVTGKPGTLLVYSAWETLALGDSRHPQHTSYVIRSAEGSLLRKVTNHGGDFDEDPIEVALPAGTYLVEARAARHGNVVVPVVIASNRATIVHLDDRHLDAADAASAAMIRLPNGQVVGWKAGAN